MELSEQIKLIIELMGAEKTLKDINKVKAGLMDLGKFTKKYGGVLPTGLKPAAEKDIKSKKRSEAWLKTRKANIEKERFMREKFLDWDIAATGKKFKTQKKLRKDYTQAVSKEGKRFKGEYMGIMFAGMQLQRVFGGLFKSMVKNYQEFTKNAVTPLSKSIIGLQANWKFLKFSIMEAASPVFSMLADKLSDIMKWLSYASPNQLKWVGFVIAGLAGLGGLAMTFGQAALLFSSLSSAALMKQGVESTRLALVATGQLDVVKLSAGTAFFNSMAKVAGFGMITVGIVDAVTAFQSFKNKEYWQGMVDSIESGISTFAGISLLKGNYKLGGALIAIRVALELVERDMFFKTLFGIFGVIAGVVSMLALTIGKLFLRSFFAGITFGISEIPFFRNKMFDEDLLELMAFDGESMKDQLSQAFNVGFSGWFESGAEADEMLQELITNAQISTDNYVKKDLIPAIDEMNILNTEAERDTHKKMYVDIYYRHHGSRRGNVDSDYTEAWGKRFSETMSKINTSSKT